MASPHDIRRRALQAMYQLDVRGEADADAVRSSLDEAEDLSPAERDKAWDLARAAHATRRDADDALKRLAPDWPAYRQPALDRAIIRLAHHELAAGRAAPAIVINEAVELAKEFSTERSPGFVNAVLDRIAKAAASPQAASPEPPSAAEESA